MAKIDSNYKYLTYEEMAKNVAEKALDEFKYYGKSIREWMRIIASSDAISRQAAMDCFKKWQPYMATRLFEFEKELSALPPVALQPKTGHWIHKNNDNYDWLECSNCGYGDGGEVKYGEESYTCPYCGCCLEGVKEG